MDWYPLYNSIRVAAISTVLVFLLGIPAAYGASRVRPWGRALLDVVLSLPLALPPTVTGWLLLSLLGPHRFLGGWLYAATGARLVMHWWSAVFAGTLAALPLMYRAARLAFSRFDENLADAARTLGRSNGWILWRIRLPLCRRGLLAGAVLSFARAAGEYGATYMVAGYTPGRTATLGTAVYRLWQADNQAGALVWVLASLLLSALLLLTLYLLENPPEGGAPWN